MGVSLLNSFCGVLDQIERVITQYIIAVRTRILPIAAVCITLSKN